MQHKPLLDLIFEENDNISDVPFFFKENYYISDVLIDLWADTIELPIRSIIF